MGRRNSIRSRIQTVIFALFCWPFIVLGYQSSLTKVPQSDQALLERASHFLLAPRYQMRVPNEHKALFSLGKMLFSEKRLSRSGKKSCASCHDYTTGQDSRGFGEANPAKSTGLDGKKLPLHTPHLLDVGRDRQFSFFWDGRVYYSPRLKGFKTPLSELSGPSESVEWSDVAQEIDSALAMQSIFPMMNPREMWGQTHGSGDDPQEKRKWIEGAILSNSDYTKMFARAYPYQRSSDLNLAHIANALAVFQTYQYSTQGTRVDGYLAGDPDALTPKGKRGFKLFLSGDLRCAFCHSGPLWSGGGFQNALIPPASLADLKLDHKGRMATDGFEQQRYAFKTTGLKNLALTAPYMHNGVFQTIEEVIRHYQNPKKSFFRKTKSLTGSKEKANALTRHYWQTVSPQLQGTTFQLSEEEKSDLAFFLRCSLLEHRFFNMVSSCFIPAD